MIMLLCFFILHSDRYTIHLEKKRYAYLVDEK